jgi:TolB protein
MNFTKVIFSYILIPLTVISTFSSSALSADPTSDIYIKIGDAKIKKNVLAIPEFQFTGSTPSNTNYKSIGAELFKVINNDLSATTYFTFLDPKAFLEDPSKTAPTPAPDTPNGFNYSKWKQAGTDFLLRANFSVSGNNLTLETYTYSISKAQLIYGRKYTSTLSTSRRMAHTFCNDLIKILTGKDGFFLSKIVVGRDVAGKKVKEIFTMDWDTNNPIRVTNHNSIALSPNWSPDGKMVLYTAYIKKGPKGIRNPDLLVLELASSNRWLVSYRLGVNSGGFFHPEGKSIFLTIAEAGSSDIFRIDMDGKVLNKITSGPRGALNVEPAVSPDGKQIAFSSDRSGQPMVWIMNIDGSNLKRITWGGVYNSSPAWSPDGKKIAFAGFEKDHYDIFTINTDGSGIERLTSAKKNNGKPADNEDPVFSPDGRLVMYTSNRTGDNQIYIINMDGSDEKRLTFDGHNYFKPRWSSNLD